MIADVTDFAEKWHLRLGAVWLAVGIGVLAVDWVMTRRRGPSGPTVEALPLTLAIGLVGIWATVPDTEVSLAAAAALCPLLLQRTIRRRHLGPAATAVVVASCAVATATGSAGRATAVAGGVCCALVPVGLVVAGDRGRRVPPALAIVAAIVASVLGSRVIGHL